MRLTKATVLTTSVMLLTGIAQAGVNPPVVEDFNDGPANWFNGPGTAVADWEPNGGPNGAGDGFITADAAFADAGMFGLTLFRGQDNFDSSNDAFVGDWANNGVNAFTFSFRHNAPTPVNLFVRFATPANFPAAVGLVFQPALPNTWTDLSIPLGPDSPNLVFEAGDFQTVFGDLGNIQIGIEVPDGFEDDTTSYTFDFDNAAAVPGPAVLAPLVLAGVMRRRRARTS